MPLSINGNLSYFNDNNVRTTFIVKWVAPYLPQEFDPSKGIFVNADKKQRLRYYRPNWIKGIFMILLMLGLESIT